MKERMELLKGAVQRAREAIQSCVALPNCDYEALMTRGLSDDDAEGEVAQTILRDTADAIEEGLA